MARHPAYHSWTNMKRRCNNPKYHHAYRYSGRGISYDPKWETFSGFIEDMGDAFQPGLTLDRIDNNGGYFKSNCRWATMMEQNNNTGRNHWFSFDGETRTISQWVRYLKLKQSTVTMRLHYGWSESKALELEV